MNFFEHILNFITDRSKRLSTRATVSILTIVCILLVDNIFGFSFYYNKQRQLSQLQSVSLLLKDSTLSNETHSKLVLLEKQALNRKSIIDHSLSFLHNMSWTSSRQDQNLTDGNVKTLRNNFWFLISSSGLYILATIFIVPVILLTDKKTPFLKLFASMVLFIVVMIFTSWFNYWLFDKVIPNRLFGSWIWNYIVNFAVQIGLILGLYSSTQIMNKVSEANNG